MIKTHSDDPDVTQAAARAAGIVDEVLAALPKAEAFDYGGHILKIDEYDMCAQCTVPIAEAQAAHEALVKKAAKEKDSVVKEHVALAAELFRLEAEAATVRAELHNGKGSEQLLNRLLGYQYERGVHENYQHSHHRGA